MISIIVTIYNTGKYLRQCVDSILKSTFQDYELILIDDGSSDGSGDICDEYASRDNRIVVFHKSNAGVSEARNTGLSMAKGDYILFVDGDDLIHPNMIQVLFDAIHEDDYDFSMVKGLMVKEGECDDYLNDKNLGLNTNHVALSQSDMIKGLYGPSGQDFQYIVVWNKLYKSHLVQDLRFIRTGSEDTEWTNRALMRIKKGVLVNEELYYWIQHPSSMTHLGINPTLVDRINSYALCLNAIPQDKPQYRAWCLEKLFKVILHTRYNAEGSDLEDNAKLLASSVYKQTINDFLKSDLQWKSKWGLLCFYHFPSIYRRFMKRKH